MTTPASTGDYLTSNETTGLITHMHNLVRKERSFYGMDRTLQLHSEGVQAAAIAERTEGRYSWNGVQN